jgi:hypothetical protein
MIDNVDGGGGWCFWVDGGRVFDDLLEVRVCWIAGNCLMVA